jgi:hypothetical protein
MVESPICQINMSHQNLTTQIKTLDNISYYS